MEKAEEELERRSKFLSSLIQKKKSVQQEEQHELLNVRVRASDMPTSLQNQAFRCARHLLDSMPNKLDSKRLALALKKEFDSSYGPAWHCIVGTSFGSYVTHSVGGFLYFSIDKLICKIRHQSGSPSTSYVLILRNSNGSSYWPNSMIHLNGEKLLRIPIRRRKKVPGNNTENDFLGKGNLVISMSPFLANKPHPYEPYMLNYLLSFLPTSSLSLSVMDVSQTDENTKNHQITMCLPQSIQDKLSGLKLGEKLIKPAQPHEALFLVLMRLNLFELLTLSRVCKLFKEAIDNDILLWLDIVVESPLNMRITDDILLKFTSKALGRLRSLVLMNCVRITDDGLLKVIEKNPHIEKLYIPSCTQLTPDGVVRVVKSLTDQSNKLKFLRLENVRNLTKEHLQILQSCLKISPEEQKPKVYLAYGFFPTLSDTNAIDVEVCPKCKNVKLVFECPRETCRSKNKRPLQACKGCLHCIPRCEGCGGCVDLDETGETACLDVVCLDCWLKLPKCNLCNKPYCNRHADDIQWSQPYSTGFVCDSCTGEMEQWLASPC